MQGGNGAAPFSWIVTTLGGDGWNLQRAEDNKEVIAIASHEWSTLQCCCSLTDLPERFNVVVGCRLTLLLLDIASLFVVAQVAGHCAGTGPKDEDPFELTVSLE